MNMPLFFQSPTGIYILLFIHIFQIRELQKYISRVSWELEQGYENVLSSGWGSGGQMNVIPVFQRLAIASRLTLQTGLFALDLLVAILALHPAHSL